MGHEFGKISLGGGAEPPELKGGENPWAALWTSLGSKLKVHLLQEAFPDYLMYGPQKIAAS